MKVAVLKGGWSAEREVSLVSGTQCANALRENGHDVIEIDVQPDIGEVLAREKPDVAFNALHGQFGEDGCIQGLLELLKIPYTHSGVLASALAMDKPMAKRVFEANGLKTPRGISISREELFAGDPMPRPYVAKPPSEGSSVGVQLMFKDTNFTFSPETWPFPGEVLIEEYIPGREITVAVMGDKALGVTEIRPKSGFYDYDNKYKEGRTEHLCPAPLTAEQTERVKEISLKAHHALGCRGLSRSDLRLNEENGSLDFYLLEVNTQPGMTPLSLAPEIAASVGISFNSLVQMLVDDARLGA